MSRRKRPGIGILLAPGGFVVINGNSLFRQHSIVFGRAIGRPAVLIDGRESDT